MRGDPRAEERAARARRRADERGERDREERELEQELAAERLAQREAGLLRRGQHRAAWAKVIGGSLERASTQRERARRVAPATGVENALWGFAWSTLAVGVLLALTLSKTNELTPAGVEEKISLETALAWLGFGVSGWALWGLGATILRFLGDIRDCLLPDENEEISGV